MTPARPITLATVLVRRGNLVESEIHGEIVALNLDGGGVYGLNGVSARVWQLTADAVRAADICASLQAEYQVAKEICEREVLALLEDLHREGLVTIVEPAA